MNIFIFCLVRDLTRRIFLGLRAVYEKIQLQAIESL